QKGGVGKTTTSVNLAASLASAKRRVLLVDIDPQGNATMGSGINKMTVAASTYEVLMGEKEITEVIIPSAESGYDLLPGNSDLTGAEVALLEELAREVRLRQALEQVSGNYDFIFIDCPPALNMLTVNALVAATSVMIPMQCEYYALEGLTDLLTSIEKIRKYLNPGLRIEGLVRTMYDPRNNLATEVSAQLLEHFGDQVYQTIIPRNVRLAEAPSYGLPVLKYDKSSRGALAYLELAVEVLRREKAAAAA
ncbi:MAG: ParA family protein, partial [Gammaproteobacteria bacterium]